MIFIITPYVILMVLDIINLKKNKRKKDMYIYILMCGILVVLISLVYFNRIPRKLLKGFVNLIS